MKRIIVVLLFALVTVTVAQASNESIVGEYSGVFIGPRGGSAGLRITIASLEGQNVKGEVVFYGEFCSGAFPMDGTIVDGVVTLRSYRVGRCGERKFNLRLDGNALSGTLTIVTGHTYGVEVSKSK